MPNRPLVGLKPVDPRKSALERVAQATRPIPRKFRLGTRKAGSRALFRGSTGFSPTSGRFSGVDGLGVTPSMVSRILE